MSEEIQGLKIVFGANFDDFERQLTAFNKAANTTQKQLKKIDKSLKVDPSNTALLTEKMSLLGSQAQNVQAQMNALSGKMANASAEAKRLAASEENIAMKAAQALSAYNLLDDSLSRLKNGMKAIADAHGMVFDRDKPLAFVAEIEKAGVATDAEKEKLKLLTSEYKRLASTWESVSEANKAAQEALGLRDSKIDLEKMHVELVKILEDMSRIEYMDLDKAKSEEFRKIAQAADLCESEISALEERGKKLDEALRVNPNNLSVVKDKLDNTKDAAQTVKNKISLLNDEMSMLDKNAKSAASGKSMLQLKTEADKAEESFNKLNAELAETRAKISEAKSKIDQFGLSSTDAWGHSAGAIYNLRGEIDRLTSEEIYLKTRADAANQVMRKAKDAAKYKEIASEVGILESKLASMTEVSKGMSYSMAASVRDIATTMSATVTPVLTAGLYGIVSKADDLDTAFRSMTKTVNGTSSQFEKLKDEAIAFSQTHAVSATQILEVEAMGGQLGIAVENLGEFAEVASNLDIATDMDADTISEQLGQFNNVLEWGEGDMSRFGDALVRLGNNMPVQESKISNVATQIASMGSLVGMSTPEILAWSAAIAATGQGAESSGTAIQNTMSDIESAVASGGDKLQAFASIAGMSADEFAASWNDGRASDVMKSFIEGLKGLEEESGSATQALGDLGITGTRQVRAIEGLMKTVDTLDEALAMSGDAWYGLTDQYGHAGDAAIEADKKQRGLSGSLQKMRINIENVASVAGDQLVPWVNLLSDALKGLTKMLQDSDGAIVNAAVGTAGLVAVISPVARIVSQAYGSYINFNGIIEKNRKKLVEAAYASGALTAAQRDGYLATGRWSKEIKVATQEAQKMEKAQTKVTASAMAGKAALAGLAIAAVALVVSKIVEYNREAERTRQANMSLKDSYSAVSAAARDGGDSISASMTVSASAAKAAADDIIQKNLDLSESFSDHMKSVLDSNAEIDAYAETLHSLGGDMSSLSNGEATQLGLALDALNQLLGEHYDLVAQEDGSYKIMSDGAEVAIETIDRLIQKKREEAQMEAYNQLNIETTKALTEAQKEQQVAAANLAKAQADYDSQLDLAAQGIPGAAEALTGYAFVLSNAQGEYDKATQGCDALKSKQTELQNAMAICSASIDENATATERALGASSDWTMALSSYGVQGLSDFASYCDYAGISVDQLQSASALDISTMISNWQSWAQGTSDSLGDAAEAMQNMPEEAGDALGDVPDAAQDSVDETTTVLETLEDVMDYVAKNGVDGLVSGLESGQVRVSEAAKKLVNSAKRTLTFTLQIKSPSRVMRKIGRFTGEGFALGMKDERKNVERMAGGLAEGAVNVIRDGSYASSLGAAFTASSRASYAQQTINSGDTMLITNLTIEAKDADSAESLYKQLRKVQMKNRR